MRLRGVDFGPCLDAAGVRGFFGEGYRHHSLMRWLPGFSFAGSCLVSKTTTLNRQIGNMPLSENDGITPKEWLPKCIYVDFRRGIMLNAVALSGPGAQFLLETGRWQKLTEPFFISFMSVAPTMKERLRELDEFVWLLKRHLPNFSRDRNKRLQVGLQMNLSCQNVDVDHGSAESTAEEALLMLSLAAGLQIPLMPKFNILMPPAQVYKVAQHGHCDALCFTNTLKWGQLPDKIDWHGLFGSTTSPLARFGGGSLSGKPLLPLVADYTRRLQQADVTRPLNIGGGILGPSDICLLEGTGASSVFVGSISTLRPHLLQPTIRQAHRVF